MRNVLALAFAGTLTAATFANAATVTTTTISPDQETAIETYVTGHQVTAVEAPSGFVVETGAVLPDTIEIHEIPADVGVTGYGYTVIGGKRLIVGTDRKIIRVLP